MINDYYQAGFVPSFPKELILTLLIAFAAAAITGAFYRVPKFLEKRGLDGYDNLAQTVTVMVATIIVIGLYNYDGVVQLLANILRLNTDTSILYVDAVASVLCGAFVIAVGLSFMQIKKVCYRKFHFLASR
ncbi:hypothetical protein IKG50_00405 [Candidatus Saccharibacteria bacterium]|nr:hypothetical protein [Candidatus Saccharibacteria bacterium]